MEEIKRLLNQILANQAVLYKKLEKMQDKADNRLRSQSDKTYLEDLEKEAKKFLEHLHN